MVILVLHFGTLAYLSTWKIGFTSKDEASNQPRIEQSNSINSRCLLSQNHISICPLLPMDLDILTDFFGHGIKAWIDHQDKRPGALKRCRAVAGLALGDYVTWRHMKGMMISRYMILMNLLLLIGWGASFSQRIIFISSIFNWVFFWYYIYMHPETNITSG